MQHPATPDGQSPEKNLIFAVLSQTVTDLFSARKNPTTIRVEALAFLTDQSGGWAASRDLLCSLVQLDGNVLRARVILALEGSPLKLGENEKAVNAIDLARDLWARKLPAAAPTVLPKIRRPPPKPSKPKRPPKPTAIDVIDALRDGPKTIREINFALHGEIDTSTIRNHLQAARDHNLVDDQDRPFWKFKEPEMAVAANTG